MHKRLVALVAVALSLALAAAACGGGGGETGGEEGGTITIGGQTANDHGSEDVSGKGEISLEADNFYFEPTVLNGSGGQKVEVEVENESPTTHNFSVDSLGIDEDVDAGKKVTVEVTLPQSGTLVFYCKFHQSQGMLGQFAIS